MTTFDHPVPTSTAHQNRIRLFQATRRPAYLNDVVIETAWGKVAITGKLGQAHADVVESIMFCCEKCRKTQDGRIKLLVDPFQVQKRAGLSSRKQLNKLLTEIMGAVVRVDIPSRGIRSVGHIVDHMTEATNTAGEVITLRNPLGGERVKWRIELGKTLTEIIESDIWVGYDPSPIARLGHGISQAVVRHILSHRMEPCGGWTLDGLIRTVAGDLEDGKLRKARFLLRSDAAGMKAIGVLVYGGRVRRVPQTPDRVPQTPDRVPQTPGAFHKPPVVAGLSVSSDCAELAP